MPCSRRRATSRSRVRADVMPMPLCRVVIHRHSGRPLSQSPISSRAACRVRSTCSGVTETYPFATASKSVPSPASAPSPGRADPVHRAPARVGRAHDGLGAVTVAETRRLEAAQLLVRHVGHVDVEDHRRVQRRALQPHDQFARDACRGGEVAAVAQDQRDRDRRQTEEAPFDGGRHRARIEHVVARGSARR